MTADRTDHLEQIIVLLTQALAIADQQREGLLSAKLADCLCHATSRTAGLG